MYEQVDFQFRYQPGSASPYALLLRYLQPRKRRDKQSNTLLPDDSSEFPKEQMILWALSAFWYPLACKALGSLTDAELKQKARNAIYHLQQQINYLIQVFGLDSQDFVFPASGTQLNGGGNKSERTASEIGLEPSNTSVPTAPFSTPGSQAKDDIEPLTPTLVLTRKQDDEALDEAFDN